METEEILKGNKLIAEFMGYTFNDTYCNGVIGALVGQHIHMALYESSWDWLMPCINKIYDDDLYSKYKETSGQFEKEIFINTKFIIETWLQVVEFIKWCNLNNK